jgi:hypothetical protein
VERKKRRRARRALEIIHHPVKEPVNLKAKAKSLVLNKKRRRSQIKRKVHFLQKISWHQ